MKNLLCSLFFLKGFFFAAASICAVGTLNAQVTDIEGNVYNTVTIGTQVWMAENLKTTKFNDGTAIPLVTTDNDLWFNLTNPAYCWYNNDESTYKATYGAMYNWYTVNTGKLCPAGWHIPTDAQWTTLTTYLGGEATAGSKLKETGTSHWLSPNLGATNETGFTAIPGGYRNYIGIFYSIGNSGNWWSSTENSTTYAWYWSMITAGYGIGRTYLFKQDGLSVRCLQDSQAALPTVSTTVVSNIAQTTATSGGNITANGGAIITARGVCWSTSANPTIANSKTTDGTGMASFTSSLTGLTENTTYYLRAYATNSAGTAYGNQVSFTTLTSNNGIIFNPNLSYGTMTDIEGNVYKTISIGTQLWMAENLKTIKYKDGTAIQLVTDNAAWGSLTTPAYCWYNNDENTYKNTYGSLYNWYTVNTGKLCPTGWHVPSNSEWAILTNSLGGDNVASGKLKEIGSTRWKSPNTGATNETGFTALPGGSRNISSAFDFIGWYGFWWSSTQNSASSAWNRDMYFDFSNVNIRNNDMPNGFSVRCISGELSLTILSTAAASNITGTSAVSGGNISSDGGAAITARGVCWSTSANPTIANSKTLDGTGTGAFTSSITGLTTGTKYYARAYATNSFGTTYGAEVSFTAGQITTRTGSDYYLPLGVGNYTQLHTTVVPPGSNWGTRTTYYNILRSESINGVPFFVEQAKEIMDNNQSDIHIIRCGWLRKDNNGNIVIGAYDPSGTGNLSSAIIASTPYSLFPNEFLTVGYSRTLQYDVGVSQTDSVISVTATAGSYTDCIQLRTTRKTNGTVDMVENYFYAYHVGLVMSNRTLPAVQAHTSYLVQYVVNDPAASKTINTTAGGLATALTPTELGATTNLKITGTIDARDFKTMRDNMPLLTNLDISGVNVISYSGTAGPNDGQTTYAANAIPNHAFYVQMTNTGKKSLRTIQLPPTITKIEGAAFTASGLTSVNLPNGATTIEDWAFAGCWLNSLYLPASLSSIGLCAFTYNNPLPSIQVAGDHPYFTAVDGVLFDKTQKTVLCYPNGKAGPCYQIPMGVTAIGQSAFAGWGLEQVIIPNSMVTLSRYAFYDCGSLKTIEIPASVTFIGESAFYNCNRLSSITVHAASPVDISSSANVFYNVNKSTCTLYVPAGSKADYQAANQWKDFVNIVEIQNTNAVVKKTTTAPVVDGTIDAVWANANTYNITVPIGTPTLGQPGTTTWKALWTNDGIYILLQVNDDVFYPAYAATPPGNDWMYDRPEIYFDVNQVLKDANGPVNSNDGHYQFAPGFVESQINKGAFTNWDGSTCAFTVTKPTYVAEYFIPFNKLLDKNGIEVPKTATIGFDVIILDRDNEATPRQNAAWSDNGSNGGAWNNMDGCGTITLEGAEAGILVNGITVNSAGNATTIETNVGTLQMSASILPVNATNPNVQWSVTNGTGNATIDGNGLLSAYSNGTVTVNAKSMDGSYITASKLITISNQTFTPPDPATMVISLIGNAFYASDGVTPANWDYDIDLTFVGTTNNISSYRINNLELLTNGEFKIRRDHQWNESAGYSDITITGDPTNFTEIGANQNIKVLAGNKYEITFLINWAANTRTLALNFLIPTVTTASASSITSTSATSGGDVVNSSSNPVTARGVCCGTSANPTVALSTKTTNGSGNGAFASYITGLSVATTYHVRAYATTAISTYYGADVTFTTTATSTTHFTPAWTGNGFDQMNINIYSAKMEGVELEAGDEVGIFDGTICAGVGKLTGAITQQSTLDIVVSKNDGSGNGYTPGNAITFKLYDASKTQEMSNVTALYSTDNPFWGTDGKFAVGVTSFAALTGVTKVIQDITMNTGWNIISAYVVPANLDLKVLFQSLIDAGSLKKVMDEAGKTIENFGAFGGWKNNIGNLNSSKGYKVNVTVASTLSLEGVPVTLPFSIPLATGWNIISYPSATGQDAMALVQPLIDAGQLKKVMDEAGKTIENFGAFGGWKNNIGNFLPGKGYKVNVASSCILTISASANKSAVIVSEVLASSHFTKVFSGNGTDHFNVHLVDLASSGLQAGDQIGIFDGKACVGAAAIGQAQLLSGNISIPASCNEEQTGVVNGFTVGHPVTLQLYRENQTYPLTPAKVSGSDAFEKNGSFFLKVTASDLPAAKINAATDQVKCYPNPFSDQLTIVIRLTEPKNLEVKIYDLSGKLLRSLFKGEAATSETLIWDGTNGNGVKMISGTYILKANEMIEKIVLKK